ncbi:uncharacterized protein A4U43_C04F14430 [Asparagus officinalis]|uniref:Uncharacterized protein n=1 Tax=Asparagus officinalis TaxID=4686 RepID=A0A5P1F1B6_ASPOF|nr:uncharacterized protein A4U43_C04F14430 [Asparagus officinalis]
MRSSLFKRLSTRSIPLASNSSIPCRSSCSRHYTVSVSEAAEEAGSVTLPREGPEFSFALNWALAGRGVIVKDKVLHNLDSSELQKNGATRLGCI